jgi:hypothetical protein
LKCLARAGELIAESDPSKVLTVEPRTRKMPADAAGSSSSSAGAAGEDEEQQQPRSRSLREFYVRQEAAELYSAEPADSSKPNNPMRVQLDTESSKVADHACRRADQAPEGSQHAVAAFRLLPGYGFQQRAGVLVNGLAAARKQLWQSGHPGITLTLQRTLVERKVQQRDAAAGLAAAAEEEGPTQQQEQQQQDTESSSSGSGSSGGSAGEEGVRTMMQPSYLVRVYSTLPREGDARRRAQSAERTGRQQPAGGRSKDGGDERVSGGGVRPGSRPGFVQVPAAEWAALREQLEVVPHLTQQLQTMTRQHEQLLSLLAAQQQGGGAGGQQMTQLKSSSNSSGSQGDNVCEAVGGSG